MAPIFGKGGGVVLASVLGGKSLPQGGSKPKPFIVTYMVAEITPVKMQACYKFIHFFCLFSISSS